MELENKEKTPFVFSQTQTPVRLKDVEFRSLQLSEDVSVGWMIGKLGENKLSQYIPNTESEILDWGCSLDQILGTLENERTNIISKTFVMNILIKPCSEDQSNLHQHPSQDPCQVYVDCASFGHHYNQW